MAVILKWHGDAFKKDVEKLLNDTGDETSLAILKDARKNINDKSGELSKSGRIIKFSKDDVLGWYIKFGNRIAYWGPFVELGTPGSTVRTGGTRKPVKAKPYLRPALKKNKRKFLRYKRTI